MRCLIFCTLLSLQIACAPHTPLVLNSESKATNPNFLETPDSPIGPEEIPPELLNFKALVFGSSVDQAEVLSLDLEKRVLELSLPLSIPQLEVAEIHSSIKSLPGASILKRVNNIQMAELVLRIPFKYLIQGADFLSHGRLPNSDPLPSPLPSDMSHLSIYLDTAKTQKISIFIGPQQVGVLFTSPMDPFLPMTLHIREGEFQPALGSFSIIPEKAGHHGGMMTAITLPSDIQSKLEDLLQ